MPFIQRILETALYVDDIELTAKWYTDVFGFERLLADDRLIALNVAPHSVLLLFTKGASIDISEVPGGVIPPHDGEGKVHFAFSIAESELDEWRTFLQRKCVSIEAEVHPPFGGHSLYVRDPDGNLIELATPGLWPNDQDN